MSDPWELRALPWRLDSGDLEWQIFDRDDTLLATFYVNHAVAKWVVDRANDSWEAMMKERKQDLEARGMLEHREPVYSYTGGVDPGSREVLERLRDA